MLKYVIKRLLIMVPTFFVVTLVIFFVLNLAPGRPGQIGQQGMKETSESAGQNESYRLFKEQFNLDKPVLLNTRFDLDQAEIEELVGTVVRYRYKNLGEKERPPVADVVEAQDLIEDMGNYIVPHLYHIALSHPDVDHRWYAQQRLTINARRRLINEFASAQQPPEIAAYNREVDLENTLISQWRTARDAPESEKKVVTIKWARWFETHEDRFVYDGWEKARLMVFDTRFANYWGNLIKLDLGVSNLDRQPIVDKILHKLRYSITLSFGSLILIYLISVPLGVFSAVKQNSMPDRVLTVILFLLYSLPSFFVGVMLLKLLSIGPEYELWPSMPPPEKLAEIGTVVTQNELLVGRLVVAAVVLIYVGYSAWRAISKPEERTPWQLFFKGIIALLIFMGSSLIVQLVLYGSLEMFPTGGFESDTAARDMTTLGRLADILHHLVLPMICLTYAGLAVISRYARSGLLDVIHADYIRTARAKGLSEPVVIIKHAVRNGMIPILTLLGALLPTLVSGSVVIEIIYNIPGMGLYLFQSITMRDYNAVMGVLLVSSMLTLLGILISDISYALVDPRISFE